MLVNAQENFFGSSIVSMEDVRDTVILTRATEKIDQLLKSDNRQYYDLLGELKEGLANIDLRKIDRETRRKFSQSLGEMCSKSHAEGGIVNILFVWNVLGFNGGADSGRSVGKLIFN